MNKTIIYVILILLLLLWNCGPDKLSHNYVLDESRSVINWKGYLKNGDYTSGTIAVRSDSFPVKDGKVQGGSFSIPVSSMIITNLPTDELKQELIHHLQSEDFFNIALYPTIEFDITEILTYSELKNDKENVVSGAQYLVSGDLTILGNTNPVSFPVKIELNNDSVTVEGKVKIDRIKWGMDFAGDETAPDEFYIKPEIDVHVKLFGSKN